MTVLITHVRHYAAPACVPLLLQDHGTVFCHDTSFHDPDTARSYETEQPGAVALAAQTPMALADELSQRGATINIVIHNDVHPNTPQPIDQIHPQAFRQAFEALVMFPIQLTQALMPAMKIAGRGRMVFVTSARPLKPEPGFAVATSIRAATTSFALALAGEVAAHGIQVNVVAPNYLYSEAYYPRAQYVDDPRGAAEIAAKVPLGRLGRPSEIGELIRFLVSGKAGFVHGQVIAFTGGWP